MRSFLAFAFGWSILFWFLAGLLGGSGEGPGSILLYVGGAGPLVAALIITHFLEGREVQRDFWSRTLDPRRIPLRVLIPALLVHPAVILISAAVDVALGGEVELDRLAGAGAWMSLVLSVFIFGPLPEEMGWRGVAYDRLLGSYTALSASLILGAAWAAWHIPLFLIEGTFHHELGFAAPRFWIFLASNVPLTVIITWVYNQTDRSTLVAAVVHFSGNIVGAVLTKTDRLALFELIGLALVAGLLIARLGTSLGSSRAGSEFDEP